MNANWFGVAAAVALLVFILELLRRGILREKFAVLWLAVSTLLVVMAIVPGLLRGAADALGFEIPSNLLFFTGILFLLLVCVQLSYEVSLLEARTRRLAEDLALLTAQTRATPRGRPGTESPPGVRSDNGSD